MSFAADMKRFSDKTNTALDKTVRAITFELFRSVIQMSPVDTGRFKGNWQTSTGSPVSGVTARTDKSGAAVIAEVLAKSGGLGSVTYMANNLPYAETLEYGGYGTGPGATDKTTRDGYSMQAPYGFVRVTFSRVGSIVAKAARANKV